MTSPNDSAHSLRPRTTVFYLHRVRNPVRWIWAFVGSLRRHAAGAPFDLVVLAKGGASEALEASFAALQQRVPDCAHCRILALPDDGYDIHAYFIGARQVTTDRVLFFNSHARLLGDAWLALYENAFSALRKPALVGATASYECMDETTPFPNPHVRSNGIMLDRRFWLSLDQPANSKRACNGFEAGPDGLSRRIERAGGEYGIVTRHGAFSASEQWPEVQGFRLGQQEDLLVTDNRTFDYARASLRKRRRLARLAWGDQLRVAPDAWLKRMRMTWARDRELLKLTRQL